MNSLCTLLAEVISNKFNIDAIVFISKKKKHIHLSLKKPLYEYSNHNHIITFIRKYFEERIMFCEHYVLNFPRLNQSIFDFCELHPYGSKVALIFDHTGTQQKKCFCYKNQLL